MNPAFEVEIQRNENIKNLKSDLKEKKMIEKQLLALVKDADVQTSSTQTPQNEEFDHESLINQNYNDLLQLNSLVSELVNKGQFL